MSQTSSLLRHLPPVTYAEPPGGSGPSLNDLLLIFEKLLVGIEDDVRVEHRAQDETSPHLHEGLQATISRIPDLLSPWKTPAELLPMLASWLALDLPDFWDEYQRRKIVSEIAEIYRLRGTKAGLQRFLELHVVGETRPRIVIDDGSRVLICRPERGTLAPIHTLLSQASFDLEEPPGSPFRPQCVATTPDGDLYVGGFFYTTTNSGSKKSPCVHIRKAGGMSSEIWRPEGSDNSIIALAVRSTDGQNTEVYALSGDMQLFLVNTDQSIKKWGTDYQPRGMVIGPDLNLFILAEHGSKNVVLFEHQVPSPEKELQPKEEKEKDETPVATLVMDGVTNPGPTTLSLAISKGLEDNWFLYVGVAGEEKTKSAQVFKFKMSNEEQQWRGTPLLPEATAVDLAAPISLVALDGQTLYVLDAGLKPFAPDSNYPILAHIARSPAIYCLRSEAGKDFWEATQESRADMLVYPTGMACHGKTFYICDPGLGPELKSHLIGSSVADHEFHVVVHFPRKSLDDSAKDTQLIGTEAKTLANIHSIVAAERPAHTTYTIVSQF